MASEITSNTQPVSASARQAAKVKSYVNHQLEKTRKQVKTVDLIAGGLVLIAYVVGFLMIAALIDAWVWTLPVWARWVCLFLLIGGCVAYTLMAIVPLLLKRINPDYAARMIEDAKPTFKNSLLNYVSLRKKPEAIKPAVFDAVSRQAAANLATVPEDATVDRSKLIRLGFVLVGLTLFAVGYKMLSPKDPLQTFARIVSPGGKIAKPAVVNILDVDPGDAKVFFGEELHISAKVRGSHDPEDVRLIYSTLDGQHVDQTVFLQPDSASNQYSIDLSMAGGGIQQSLKYHIVARDGVSPEYEVTVQPNPSITIESIVLTPPAYTKMRQRTLAGPGPIDAVEGTKVQVQAIANLPIQLAYIELLNEVVDPNRPATEIAYDARYRVATTPIEMKSDGETATGNFQITLNSSREKPFATHFRIRFVSTDDDRNHQPNVYPIQVIPDLAPEVRFRTPDDREVEVPVNGALPIRLEANDLDFEIRSVGLKVEHQGSTLLDQKLEMSSEDGNRRVTAGYRLTPAELGLSVGDAAMFFGTAADNRMSPYSEQPDPNISRTENYTFRVVAADPDAEKNPDPNKPDKGAEDQKNEQPGESENDTKEDGKSESGDDESGKSEDGKSGEEKGESGDEKGESGDEKGESSDEKGESGDEKSESGDDKGEPGESGNEKGEPSDGAGSDNEKQPEDGSAGKENQPGESGSEPGENENSGDPESGADGDPNGGGSPTESPDQMPSESPNGGSESGESGTGDSDAANEGAGNEGGSESGDESNSDTGNEGASPSDPSGGNPESDPDGSGNEGSDEGGNGGPGEKDNALTDGSQEAVSDNASEGELMRKMKEHFENEEKNSKGETSQDGTGNEDAKNSAEEATTDSDGNTTNKGEPGQPEQDPNQVPDPREKEKEGGTGQNQESSETGPDGASDPNNPENDSSKGKNGKGETGQPDNSQEKQPDNGEPGQNPSEERPESDTGESGSESGESGESGAGESGESGSGKSENGNEGDGQSGTGESGKGESGKGESGEGGEGKGESGTGDPSEGSAGGSESQEGGGNSTGNDSDDQTAMSDNTGSSEESTSGQPGTSASGGQPGAGAGDQMTPGGKKPGGTGQGESSAEGDQFEREKVNQEHAKKTTDMILNKLAEQKNDPDPELLRKLKMSKEELAEFFDRWDEMKRRAERGGDKAKRKYDRALKSLGFKPDSGSNAVTQNQDKVSGLIQDGAVNEPPPELVPDFNSFIRDLGRVRDD